MDELHVIVLGVAQPQGSKTVMQRGGKAWLVDANATKLKPWRKLVTQQVLTQLGDWYLTADPIKMKIEIYLPRPSTVTRSHHTVKPDLDKLQRSILDGITDTKRVWVDDSQVVDIRAKKQYADHCEPTVEILIERAI